MKVFKMMLVALVAGMMFNGSYAQEARSERIKQMTRKLYTAPVKKLKRQLYATPEVSDVVLRTHEFLLKPDNLNCLIFGKDCSTAHRDALILMDAFLVTEPISAHVSNEMKQDRIRETERVLRDEYDVSKDEYAAIGMHVLKLLLDGYRETNWMDRQLKALPNNIAGGFNKIKKDKKLMNYLTHLYFGTIPTPETVAKMERLLNPKDAPRESGFETVLWGTWDYAKRFGKGAGSAIQRGYKYVTQKAADYRARQKKLAPVITQPGEVEEVVGEKYLESYGGFE